MSPYFFGSVWEDLTQKVKCEVGFKEEDVDN